MGLTCLFCQITITFMDKKGFLIGLLVSFVLVAGVSAAGLWIFLSGSDLKLLPISEKVSDVTPAFLKGGKDKTVFKDSKNLNVLLLGIDRRSKFQTWYNTDIMILVSVNPETNRILLISVPRDLWINGNKINALYSVQGWESLKSAFENTTGQVIDGYIRCDFEGFHWIVDAFGGVPVDVQNSFTDYNFPNNSDTAVLTVSFTEGQEIMNGQRALTFARSRQGTNGEGSDLMRSKRQHLILQGMIKAVSQPQSQFWPMDIETFYNAVTAPTRIYTTLTLDDVKYLWDFYKDKDKYVIESFVVDGNYIHHPGMYPQSPYHAWVFVPINNSWTQLHKDIKDKLNGTFVDPAQSPTENSTPTAQIQNE